MAPEQDDPLARSLRFRRVSQIESDEMLTLSVRAETTPIAHIHRRLLVMEEAEVSMLSPRFKGETILVASDYGKDPGGKYGSGFSHHTFLVVDWQAAYFWFEERSRLRASNEWKGAGRFEFKRLNKDSMARRLPAFLELSAYLPGVVVSVVVPTELRDVLGTGRLAKQLSDVGYGSYQPHIAEKLIRAVMLPFPWIALHGNPGNKIFWASDEDAITKDPQSLGTMWANAMSFCFDQQLESPGLAIVGSSGARDLFRDNCMLMVDLLSVPDLFGAAVTKLLDRPLREVKQTTDAVLRWAASGNDRNLRKYILRIESGDGEPGALKFAFLDLMPKEPAQ